MSMATNDCSSRSFATTSPLTNRMFSPRRGLSSPRCRSHYYCYSTSTTHLSQCRTEESSSNSSNSINGIKNTLEAKLDWNDRIGLQDRYSLEEKGWEIGVDWRSTPYGAGVFSKEDSVIEAGTILRRGIIGLNLKEFTSIDDIHEFCTTTGTIEGIETHGESGSSGLLYRAKLGYVKDYLWGFNKEADERGYDTNTIDKNGSSSSNNGSSISSDDDNDDKRFFGMWVPGNGLNHNETPNTVYRPTKDGIDLVALVDIRIDDELFDDYRRHGISSPWLKEFADIHNVTLNFADCNDFV